MQALAERTGAFFVRHATVPHQMTVNNKFGTEQGAAPLLRQHNNAQNELEERLPLWWAATKMENGAAASTPGPAPSFAVNEAAHTSWVASPNLSWAQQRKGSKYDPAGGPPPNLTPTWMEVAHSELVLTALKFVLWALGAGSLLYIAAMYCHARSWVLRALVHTHQCKLIGASKLKPAGVSNRKPPM